MTDSGLPSYRMGLFGFPTSSALVHDQQNPGFRDQRAALEWLRDNLASFGGDPTKITMGGESSGADAVAAMAFEYVEDPIARALLLESGQPLAALPSGDPSEEFERIAGLVGCGDEANSASELECVRGVPADTIKDAISNSTIHPIGVSSGGTPLVDNKTLFSAEEYLKRGEAGEFARLVSSQIPHQQGPQANTRLC